MHSLNHDALAIATATERRHRAVPVPRAHVRRHPPPVRGAMAAVTARLAIRLDREAARRAIA